jgi:ferric-dicitrate binding protein FerR (iron transport regulator)
MNVFARFAQWFRDRAGRSANQESEQASIDVALDSGFRRLRKFDPETSRQWQRLSGALDSARLAQKSRPVSGWVLRGRPALAVAVVVAVVVVAGILVWPRSSDIKYMTQRGQHTTITLSDSTIVSLNHTSELTVHRGQPNGDRLVMLKGEAFFQVRPNGLPFVVTTDVGTIRVLGTEFNVRERNDHLEVAVVRGKVRVNVQRDGRDSAVVLGAGEITTCTGSTYPRSPEPLLFSGYPGWTHGKFMFYRTDLSAACREIAAQFDVTIRVEHHSSETITGVVDGRNVETALATLTKLVGDTYRYENGAYILY